MNKITRLFSLLLLSTIMFLLPTASAQAALVRCRVDPHFKLSNGDMVTITLDAWTDVANIRNIHYVLHLPPGVTVTKVTYTAKSSQRTVPETYNVIPDGSTRSYVSETIVTTQAPRPVGVTVFARVNSLKERSVSGYSGQHLSITLTKQRGSQ
jgi:hypothetical protein